MESVYDKPLVYCQEYITTNIFSYVAICTYLLAFLALRLLGVCCFWSDIWKRSWKTFLYLSLMMEATSNFLSRASILFWKLRGRLAISIHFFIFLKNSIRLYSGVWVCDNIIKNIDSMKTEERRVREREGRGGREGGREREREMWYHSFHKKYLLVVSSEEHQQCIYNQHTHTHTHTRKQSQSYPSYTIVHIEPLHFKTYRSTWDYANFDHLSTRSILST